ncbi:hypothetical protein N865_21020 [Intrasporangium oryzae NRRL B-24470]|uniref:Uncharacterized protein n=1 Tax=Intrasporangium oryzae NRRL B-24470 TaxID=1386089 RepID=W9G365_9MICO|nr:hypothetical protein [Intrasporangium oryzae]EWS99741.1 hypothetical protein N865_21020 [Intrasporangium oryzae NRRL B-24470]
MTVTGTSATSAPRVTHESFTLSGLMADASWKAEEGTEPEVGAPGILYVQGAHATSTNRVPGAKPVRGPMPALLAMGLMMPGVAPGDEPYPAELWCATGDFSFTVADDLSSAALDVPTCDAQVFAVDPNTGEETPNGVTVTVAITTDWTATGPLEQQRSHSRYSVGGLWSMEMARTAMRPASADITVTGLPGGTFSGTTNEAAIQDVKVGTLQRQ